MTARAAARASAIAESRLLTVQKIGAPLMAAVSDWRYAEDADPAERSAEDDAKLFAELAKAAAALTRQVTEALGIPAEAEADWMRWRLAAISADLVAAYFRANAKAPEDGAMTPLLQAALAADLPAGQDPLGAEAADLEALLDSDLALRLQHLRGLAPVIGAISRFAFGRDPRTLFAEVAAELRQRAEAVARLLAPEPCPRDQFRALHAGILTAAAELYADAHYAEMDRLLDMTDAERAEYTEQAGGSVPLDPVWGSFDARISLLTAVADQIDIPEATMVSAPRR